MNAPLPTNIESRLVAREAEQSVLGSLLMDNDAIDRINDLQAEHFFVAEHRDIFKAILQLIMQNKTADVLTVFDKLKGSGKDSGDLVYLNAIVQNTPSSSNIKRYAEMVRDRAIKRGLVTLCREFEDSVESSGLESGALVDQLSSKLEALAQAKSKQEPMRAADDLTAHIESIDERYHGNGVKAISTGFADLDKKLNGGLRRGQLVVLAARPKMGKTAMALNLAAHCSVDHSVLVCSMEMPKSELHDRNIANLGRIPLDHLMDPRQMADADWVGLTSAVQKLTTMNLYLDDQGGLNLMDVRMKAKQVKRRHGLDVMVVDYLQLMSAEGDNRNAQIESITRGMKALAKELDITIILLSQLNRELERRPNKRPQPSDLRDSGSIEQDADMVIFLYRDEVYNPDSMDKGVCEVDVALNRQGSSGRVALAYIGEQTRFADLATNWHPAVPKTAPRTRGFSAD